MRSRGHVLGVACLFAALPGGQSRAQTPPPASAAGIQFAPPEAYLPGSDLPYFGSEGEWTNRFIEPRMDSEVDRPGQYGILAIMRGRPEEAESYARTRIARFPDDLESKFVLPIALARQRKLSEAAIALREALDAGIPPERFMAGPRMLMAELAAMPQFQQWVTERASPVIHGPLIGAVTDREAAIWVRTKQESDVEIRLRSAGEPEARPIVATARSDSARDFTAIARVAGLSPATAYEFEIFVNNEHVTLPTTPRFATFPTPGEPALFSLGFGGCAPFEPRFERVWDQIARRKYSAFLLLGDNVYIDLPEEAGAVHDYTYHRRQSRPEFRNFTSSTPVFAIWDDHDCAVDDVFMGPHRDRPSWKPSMWRLFDRNWANPPTGLPPEWPGVWHRIRIANVDIFMLDVRYYRENWRATRPSMLGPAQKAWLFRELRASNAAFKVIASGVPWAFDAKETNEQGGPYDTWFGYADERNEIFSFLTENAVTGVLLLSGDRHRSDLRVHLRKSDYPLFEFASCNLTRAKGIPPAGKTLFTYSQKASFAALHFDTTISDPRLRMEILSIDGDSVFQRTVTLGELGRPAKLRN